MPRPLTEDDIERALNEAFAKCFDDTTWLTWSMYPVYVTGRGCRK